MGSHRCARTVAYSRPCSEGPCPVLVYPAQAVLGPHIFLLLAGLDHREHGSLEGSEPGPQFAGRALLRGGDSGEAGIGQVSWDQAAPGIKGERAGVSKLPVPLLLSVGMNPGGREGQKEERIWGKTRIQSNFLAIPR